MISAIIILGFLGVWIEVLKALLEIEDANCQSIFTALIAVPPALVGASSFQLILKATDERDKILSSFGYSATCITLVFITFSSLLYADYPKQAYSILILLTFFAIWFWSFTNADNPIYKSLPIDAPSGGDTSGNPQGDLGGFTT